MRIVHITITGADDTTDLDWMAGLSDKYKNLEWGILVSKSGTGSPRFPGSEWVLGLLNRWTDSQLRLCTHICGRWMREICAGDWESFMRQNGALAGCSERLQFNFHAESHQLAEQFFIEAARRQNQHDWELIFQQDGMNEDLFRKSFQFGLNCYPLFDLSGGTGQLPAGWPKQPENLYCGYAGGLSPDNLTEQLELISQQATGEIWIDVETRVRTADNRSLDQAAVERFLEIASGWCK